MIAQRCTWRIPLFAALLVEGTLLCTLALGAQGAPPTQAAGAPAAPSAKPADVESVDAIVAALYDVISGDAGVKRDWDRFRSLFVPAARLIPTGRRPDGSGAHRALSPEEYITGNGAALEQNGFHERELGRHVDRYGNIAQVFSAYDSKRTLADSAPFMRGVNSIQLWNDGRRWWVVSIFWENESTANPIPAEYLRKP